MSPLIIYYICAIVFILLLYKQSIAFQFSPLQVFIEVFLKVFIKKYLLKIDIAIQFKNYKNNLKLNCNYFINVIIIV